MVLNRLLVGFFVLFPFAFGGLRKHPVAVATPALKIEFDVMVPMKDGTLLACTIYRPDRPGKFPVILERSPYDPKWFIDDEMNLASHGYVVVVQSVRGRFNSQGEFVPFIHEAEDGDATINWLARQPWSNGKIGMMSDSYLAATQWFAASTGNPHLRCLLPGYGASDYYKQWVYNGGALQLSFDATWAAFELQGRLDNDFNAYHLPWEMMLKHLPLLRLPMVLGWGHERIWSEWLHHPTYDSYWKVLSVEDKYNRITSPAFLYSGWYDIFLEGTITNFLGLRHKGGTSTARNETRLLIGPWFHSGQGLKTGQVDFRPMANVDWKSLRLAWFDHELKHKTDLNPVQAAPLRIFIMGENVWRNEFEWPLARTRFTKFYFHSGSHANTSQGDGKINMIFPGAEPPDHFEYDPNHPVPTVGGNACCWFPIAPEGAYDQREIEGRRDVLVYTSSTLEKAVEVTGPIEANLYVAASARDTDFTAKLCDVFPDGKSMNVSEGILRMRYRHSFEHPELIIPGRPMLARIVMHPTSNLFKVGHRIRIDISSSDFPHFDRNLNTGEPIELGIQSVVAEQTVFHEGDKPSYILLPLIPRCGFRGIVMAITESS